MRLTRCVNGIQHLGTTGYKIFNCYKGDGLEAWIGRDGRNVAPTTP